MRKALIGHLWLHATLLKVKMHMHILLLLEGVQEWLLLASAALIIQALAHLSQEVAGCKSEEDGCRTPISSENLHSESSHCQLTLNSVGHLVVQQAGQTPLPHRKMQSDSA